MFKPVHHPAALRLPGLWDNPSPGHPGRTRTAASLLCRAAATPCPAYDPCGLSLIYLPLLLKFYRQVEDT
ncbi:hypothetical protein [Klebsiella pneumoniae]|uniref:hypothetical protein n=1 Tax=Klebsiella pneumoniae TaxID=573 RepID=UPI0018A282E5|nr:hypothetical protein [Klebsiella pneumoniae]